MLRWYSDSRQWICHTIVADLRRVQDKYQVQNILNDVCQGVIAKQKSTCHFPEDEALGTWHYDIGRMFMNAFLYCFRRVNEH